ncbi:hypothetical protein [Burkholderia ubonensis]|uniref:hypothetical protein n=1 Tax=Burkholderia ubonensis TaxID=101571 RepID=UPI0012FBB2E2|nr:hypothetical protein [Burkholderia ubonensis]
MEHACHPQPLRGVVKRPHTSQLISLTIVGENGHEFYGERTDFEVTLCTDFVREVVLPQLGQFNGRSMQLVHLRSALQDWFDRIPVAGCPVLCYDLEAEIDLLRELLEGHLPTGWALENIATQIDTQRRAHYTRGTGESTTPYMMLGLMPGPVPVDSLEARAS